MIQPLDLDPPPAARKTASGVARCPGLRGVLAHAPAALAPLEAWNASERESVLRRETREAVVLRVAVLHDCAHARRMQEEELTALGIDARTRRRLGHGLSDDPREQTLLALATKLVLDRGHNAGLAVHAAREVGATDAELVELISLVGLATLASYVCNLAVSEPSPPTDAVEPR